LVELDAEIDVVDDNEEGAEAPQTVHAFEASCRDKE
jgi:hypothetical protein